MNMPRFSPTEKFPTKLDYIRRRYSPLRQPKKIEVLDGAMGTLLFSKGVPRCDEIWAARSIHDEVHHDKVVEAHLDYIKAGATSITTNNYAIMPYYYANYFGQDKFAREIKQDTKRAVDLARKAIDISGRDVFLYGCLQPTRMSLRPDLTNEYLTDSFNWRLTQHFYKIITEIMEPEVDGFLLETMNSQLELLCCLESIEGLTRKPIAISMQGSFMDPVTMEPVPYLAEHTAQLVCNLAELDRFNISMFSLNCAPPEHIEKSLGALTQSTKSRLKKNGIKLGVYANASVLESFEEGDFDTRNISSEREATDRKVIKNYKQHAMTWLEHGVTCIGGCCKVEPKTIEEIAKLVLDDNWDWSNENTV